MTAEWEQYRDRYGARPETFDAYVDAWTRLPEVQEAFTSWSAFSRAANAERTIVERDPGRVEAAEELMRRAGYELGEPTPRGARRWEAADSEDADSEDRPETVGRGREPRTPKVVLFGASGYTGKLTTAVLVEQGIEPVLAGRHGDSLAQLADHHNGLQVAIADANDPRSVRALLEAGDVLITTVGPFTLLGHAALDSAIDAGAHYIDSTGEAAFIRHVMQTAGPRAEETGSALLTAFGYDFVPGHIAGALATEAGGDDVYELQIIYSGLGQGISSGTRTTAQVMLTEATHKLDLGQVLERPVGRDVTTVDLDGAKHHLLLAGGSEPLTAGREWPEVQSVSVWLDLGPAVWLAKAASYAVPSIMNVGWIRDRVRQVGGSTGKGPDTDARARSTTTVTAIALDVTGHELTRRQIYGPNPYDITATTLAAGAIELLERGAPRAGALGPLELFGRLDLHGIAAHLGLRTV